MAKQVHIRLDDELYEALMEYTKKFGTDCSGAGYEYS